ncbi:hypothetical protein LTR36_001355 [Oleoguttula mirabilis]|uniref:Uncharacterized protein n=1 Tax=Oleoguttula mirabilis TaxID=1507867 RepID=A0AAV9JP31_9PEZI|nr:hypothetical protein LTR36_001355 [Oleoguttula mirabilis]
MPPHTALSTPLRAWRCPQCTVRSFSSTPRTQQVGPEHPRYIDIPEPPQQTVPDRKFIKGRLPVPRDVFSGADGDKKATDEWLEPHTRSPKHEVTPPQGSREEWKHKMSDMRRRNLREGIASLRVRKTRVEKRMSEQGAKNKAEREELLNRPEREDERLTAPSHGLDLDYLYTVNLADHALHDPTRAARLAFKTEKVAAHAQKKRDERLDSLHTLYLNARSFIVTPQQLDAAVDDAFGTPEAPHTFGDQSGTYGDAENAASVWAFGRPERVQDILNRANRQGSRSAMDGAGGFSGVNKERIQRIAETLTGGKMGESEEARR